VGEGGEGFRREGGLSGNAAQSSLSFFIASRMTAMYCVAASAPLFTAWALVVRVLADQMSFSPFYAKIDASAVTVFTV